MDKILKTVHAQWLIAKQQAENDCRQTNRHDLADKYHNCTMFKGTEDMAGLVNLITSPAGREFVVKRHFPSLTTFRLFKGKHPEQFGVYIDAGEIDLRNPRSAVLVGRTYATIHVDECSLHEIIVIRGAKLTLHASEWGVAHIESDRGSQVTTTTQDHAVIL